jgi:hypothetical protein
MASRTTRPAESFVTIPNPNRPPRKPHELQLRQASSESSPNERVNPPARAKLSVTLFAPFERAAKMDGKLTLLTLSANAIRKNTLPAAMLSRTKYTLKPDELLLTIIPGSRLFTVVT